MASSTPARCWHDRAHADYTTPSPFLRLAPRIARSHICGDRPGCEPKQCTQEQGRPEAAPSVAIRVSRRHGRRSEESTFVFVVPALEGAACSDGLSRSDAAKQRKRAGFVLRDNPDVPALNSAPARGDRHRDAAAYRVRAEPTMDSLTRRNYGQSDRTAPRSRAHPQGMSRKESESRSEIPVTNGSHDRFRSLTPAARSRVRSSRTRPQRTTSPLFALRGTASENEL